MNAPTDFPARIAESRAKHLSPAIGVVWVGPNGAIQTTQQGALPTDDPAQALWHIGSCTKALTATLFGRLVDQGRIAFGTSLGAALPDLAANMHPEFRAMPLSTLLTHRAGIASNPPESTFRALHRSTAPVTAQRRFLAADALRDPPRSEVGYSNLGYIILGAAIEAVTGEAWERTLAREVMIPLGIGRFGFGPPENASLTGHRWAAGKWQPEQGDNPPAYGPAGRVHLALDEWGRFLRTHLPGNRFLSPTTQERLQRETQNGFAMGWIARGAVGRRRLFHAGSNTAWFAEALLLTDAGVGVGIVCNCFDSRIERAVDDLANDLLDPNWGARS